MGPFSESSHPSLERFPSKFENLPSNRAAILGNLVEEGSVPRIILYNHFRAALFGGFIVLIVSLYILSVGKSLMVMVHSCYSYSYHCSIGISPLPSNKLMIFVSHNFILMLIVTFLDPQQYSIRKIIIGSAVSMRSVIISYKPRHVYFDGSVMLVHDQPSTSIYTFI